MTPRSRGIRALVVVGVDAVVADVRIRERDDLARVRRVGDDLLVARHRRVEHDLAGNHAALGRAPIAQPSKTSPSASTSCACLRVPLSHPRHAPAPAAHRCRHPSMTTGSPRQIV